MSVKLSDEVLEAASSLNQCIIANEHDLFIRVMGGANGNLQFSVMSAGCEEPFYCYEHKDEAIIIDQITAFQSGLWAREVA